MKTLVTILVILIVLVGGYFLFFLGQVPAPEEPVTPPTAPPEVPSPPEVPPPPATPEPPPPPPPSSAPPTPPAATPQEVSVSYGSTGFSPATITLKVGDRVVFVNESGADFWPASAVHPTHTVYPGSDIRKCGTAAAAAIFDACGPVPSGQSWTFTFTEAGTWRYHDHLNPGQTGTVVVE